LRRDFRLRVKAFIPGDIWLIEVRP
jgi:hypothetical protein